MKIETAEQALEIAKALVVYLEGGATQPVVEEEPTPAPKKKRASKKASVKKAEEPKVDLVAEFKRLAAGNLGEAGKQVRKYKVTRFTELTEAQQKQVVEALNG